MNRLLTESAKYLNLKISKDAGLTIPKTLLINSEADLETFLQDCSKNSRFIVRSIQTIEDGGEQSFAGHFWSSPAIKANEIEETIKLATQKNQEALERLQLNQKPQLMLQEFIEHKVGGVLFSPWSFFSEFFYIEYSSKGVQEAVEGKIKSAVICTAKQQTSPIALPEELQYLEEALKTTTQLLQRAFDFPIDCEWVYCEQRKQIIVLQVRPQTTPIGAALNPPPEIRQQLQTTKKWQYSAFSESLGRLSPLSYSLLEQLYKDAIPTFQELGYQAGAVNFMRRMPDGTILTDASLEKAFYKSTSFGGFWRGFRTPKYQLMAQQFVSNWETESDFSYQNLSENFRFWMLANLISQGKGRDQIAPNTSYELSWQQHQDTPQIRSKKYTWDELNPLLKSIFFYELEKLKKQLKSTPEQAFNDWKSYLTNSKKQANMINLQYQEAQLAIYDFSLLNSSQSNDGIQSIGAKTMASGKVFIIDNPNTFHQQIPNNCILIAPYFSNHWVHEIKRITAIIVEQGGQLSHSAIVARECGVPYYIAHKSVLKDINHEDTITIDSATHLIQKG